MNSTRRAVIDVGTNSIKLLVADVAGRDLRPVCEESRQTRLGRGFYENHRLQPEAIEKTAQVVAAFAETARESKTASIRVIATSAARDAVNPGELTSAIEQASGLKVEIISGEQEAEWTFLGVTSNPELARQPALILDVGGGSTEFILGQGDTMHFRRSFPLGAVRLMEKLPHGDPSTLAELNRCRAWLRDFMTNKVDAELRSALGREVHWPVQPRAAWLVGVGGTATVLARMESGMTDWDRARIEATRLTFSTVRGWTERLWRLPLAQRCQIPGLPHERADVILTGVAIYEAVTEHFDFTEMRVSTRGLRFAAVMDG